MRLFVVGLLVTFVGVSETAANTKLLKQHCGHCHSGKDAEGDFRIALLGKDPSRDNLDAWIDSLDRIRAGEMPPQDESELSASDRDKLIRYLRLGLDRFDPIDLKGKHNFRPRRMNNREFARSIADVLMIEDVGTHLPIDNLIGDSRFHGFDTHAETLGFSNFHLEQYIRSVRSIVNATILSDQRPSAQRYSISPDQIFSETRSQNTNRPERKGKREWFDFLDPNRLAYFAPFKHVPSTGWYQIRIQVVAMDRAKYDADETGIYDDDPIRLRVEMGNRERIIELPDNEIFEVELKEWLAKSSRLRLQHPTDGLRLVGNGNFKFQNRLTAIYFKKYEPDRYAELVRTFKPAKNGRPRSPDAWQNWVDLWMGPRPRVLGAVIEGPIFESWPPQRQINLIGSKPSIDDAEIVLNRIAERAWRRPVRDGELTEILRLVRSVEADLGIVEALKEGIVAILVSPQFLLLNTEDLTSDERFASKLSYFIRGTTPTPGLRHSVTERCFDSHAKIVAELRRSVKIGDADSFLKSFPFAWLELNDINFMAPDPDKYRHYHRKLVSDDMVNEVLHFFRHAVQENIRVPDLLLCDYSFINADLAKVYGLEDVPQDSTFRKYTFGDGRRGGLLGMGAFLTLTADSLFTSPIHRAIYVMENYLGIHPTPPPADVEISEPDVRQAKTIKDILSAHRSDKNCLSCHQLIDPFGYAFENFGPDGSWRDDYTIEAILDEAAVANKQKSPRTMVKSVPIDASAEFLSGASYDEIEGYRNILSNKATQSRIVRCFVTKLLTYANGAEPASVQFAEIDHIMEVSAKHDYRIVETIAAVIDSPLFRESERSH